MQVRNVLDVSLDLWTANVLLKAMVKVAESRLELERKETQTNEMKLKIPELLAELDTKTREKDEYRVSSKRFEAQLNKRKDQLNEVISRHTDQIANCGA
jgi:TPP-dependent 2-oxoacid decarboxylase